ncbi:hypothetical protein [Paracoccus sp. ME4]|uniref:hypothetical protein n=1 Tax=Paracoccus sp. ME4 TaxID=3138066 RepID=UPI00398B97E4
MTDAGIRDTYVFASMFGEYPVLDNETNAHFRDADNTADNLRFYGDCTIYAAPASAFEVREGEPFGFSGDLKDGIVPARFVLDITIEIEPDDWAREAVEAMRAEPSSEATPAP